LYLNTGTSDAPIAVTLFFGIQLISLLFLISWYVPSSIFLSFVDVVCPQFFQSLGIYVFPCLNFCIYLLESNIKFFERTNFPVLNTICAHLSSPKSIWISSLKILTTFICFWEFFLCFTNQLQIIQAK
jgi:hypothetical protein